jgi:hypothetical protein
VASWWVGYKFSVLINNYGKTPWGWYAFLDSGKEKDLV